MTNHQAMHLRAAVGSKVTHWTRYRGMLVLVLWQMPVQPVVKPNGTIGLLIGGGSDEHAQLSCSGDLVNSHKVSHRVAAVEADYSLSPLVRIEAVGGLMRSDWTSHDGAFGTVLMRADWEQFGLGAGIAVSPSFDEYGTVPPEADEHDGWSNVWPSAHLRVGGAKGLHMRADLFPPTAFAAQQIGRVGLGFNAVDRDRVGVFIGVAGVGSNEAATGIAADLTVPVADRFGIRLQGYYADGYQHPVGGFAVGGRVLLGRAPVATVGRGAVAGACRQHGASSSR